MDFSNGYRRESLLTPSAAAISIDLFVLKRVKTYVALLRGIGPSNPNMHQAKLKDVFEKIGFRNVRALLSSGNVVFESSSKDEARVEAKIEKALPKMLGFSSAVFVRSQKELDELLKCSPFGKDATDPRWYPLVTFLKYPPQKARMLKKDARYKVYGMYGRVLCSAPLHEKLKKVDFMGLLEKQYGKQITSRTWRTVGRIVRYMHTSSQSRRS